jgi:hypothetical protein
MHSRARFARTDAGLVVLAGALDTAPDAPVGHEIV